MRGLLNSLLTTLNNITVCTLQLPVRLSHKLLENLSATFKILGNFSFFSIFKIIFLLFSRHLLLSFERKVSQIQLVYTTVWVCGLQHSPNYQCQLGIAPLSRRSAVSHDTFFKMAATLTAMKARLSLLRKLKGCREQISLPPKKLK